MPIMPQSFITTPEPMGGRLIAKQICRVLTFTLSPHCGENAGNVCYRQKNIRHRGVGLIAWIIRTKIPRFSPGIGVGP